MEKKSEKLLYLKNNILISADYNQIEMRILADMADVKELKKAFKENLDIHSMTASQVFGVPIKKINESLRERQKLLILELFTA